MKGWPETCPGAPISPWETLSGRPAISFPQGRVSLGENYPSPAWLPEQGERPPGVSLTSAPSLLLPCPFPTKLHLPLIKRPQEAAFPEEGSLPIPPEPCPSPGCPGSSWCPQGSAPAPEQPRLSPYRSPFDLRFWRLFPLGLLSLPMQKTPPGPVTRMDSKPLDDFLKVNSTASPSFRLRKPSMWSLLWGSTGRGWGSAQSWDVLQAHHKPLPWHESCQRPPSACPLFLLFFLNTKGSRGFAQSRSQLVAGREEGQEAGSWHCRPPRCSSPHFDPFNCLQSLIKQPFGTGLSLLGASPIPSRNTTSVITTRSN